VTGSGVGTGAVAGDQLEIGVHSDGVWGDLTGDVENQFTLISSQFNDGGEAVCLSVADDPRPRAQRRPDLVQRDFSAAGRNELWIADFTYLRCWEGLVFFAFVVDAYSREVVGWQFAAHMRTDLVLDAPRMAFAMTDRVDEVELVHHSDAGSHPVASFDYGQTLDDHQVPASIGSVGDAYDNALAESFVDSFKTELIRDRVWRSRSQLELAIVEYVASFNSERLHSALGDVPPTEYEEVGSRR
jgi:putative transposase